MGFLKCLTCGSKCCVRSINEFDKTHLRHARKDEIKEKLHISYPRRSQSDSIGKRHKMRHVFSNESNLRKDAGKLFEARQKMRQGKW